ncbi:NUDIX domain-containing protein [Kineococcus xinjiangensis]|uniref:NUDIX domain-containing protein n=1 Tax=Kineococcus xinjiangensis TaxID=512762 RepID=A0A2S6IWL2_9ACTN|nr:NUDIX domain-containing protein [Kineococcus xinjiangensis]PPK98747.1 NUDIX domain-containing protein [Kineococcus xinjiangensis]
MSWLPGAGLVADARARIGAAPGDTPEARFERDAWAALLDTTGPALLTRAAAPAHVTSSALLVTPEGHRTCLVLHARMRLWVQPGGHLEAGDTSLAGAAARELAEETGLRADVRPRPLALSRHRAPCRPAEVDWHLDVQHLAVAPETPPAVSPESLHVAWWDVDDLPADLAPGVAGLVALAAGAVSTP